MAGHSKWATTKRHKAAQDSKRGKAFSIISKELTLAARTGGGDPEFNPRLRTLVNKAKATNMPAENVDRAIKKGTGELPGVIIEELTYEGYGPGGVGLIVEVTTDNKNRSASEVRSTLSKHGGNLATPGALDFNFQRKGQFIIGAEHTDEETLMELALEAGAEDVLVEDSHFEILSDIGDFDAIAQMLAEKEIPVESQELAYIPNTTNEITDAATARKILGLIDKLDDLEDVKNVWSNLDIANDLLDE